MLQHRQRIQDDGDVHPFCSSAPWSGVIFQDDAMIGTATIPFRTALQIDRYTDRSPAGRSRGRGCKPLGPKTECPTVPARDQSRAIGPMTSRESPMRRIICLTSIVAVLATAN